MEWTRAQQQVLEHGDGWLQVRGLAGSGKTAVLVARWRKARAAGAENGVLVLCPSRHGADRFRRAALGDRWWAGEDLPFTTVYGAAFDLVRRHRGDRRLLTRAEQWSAVRRLLAEDSPACWPSCPEFVGRAAFVDEVAAALAGVERAGTEEASLLAVAEAWGEGGRWVDLMAFRGRYRQAIEAMGALDGDRVFTEAAEILANPSVAVAESSRWQEVLIDDADLLTSPMGRLVEALAPARLVAAGDADGGGPDALSVPAWFDRFQWPTTVQLAQRHRITVAPAVVRCSHPATEADAIAGVLLDAHEGGVPWHDMAVLMRRERPRAESVGRALARHGVPVRATPGSSAGEPAVQAIIDFFRWASGDPVAGERLLVSPAVDLPPGDLRRLRRSQARDGSGLPDHPRVTQLVALRDRLAPHLDSSDPADLAYQAWVGLLAGLVPDPEGADRGGDAIGSRALDAVAAFVGAISRRSAHDPTWRIADELALVDGPEFDADPWVPLATGSEDELVTVGTIGASFGRTWDTVVIAGCLEGELPRVSGSGRFFHPGVPERAAEAERAGGNEGLPVTCRPPTLAEQRQESLYEERRLFARATSRARRRLVATAAPAPGQLVSRFVSDAASEAAHLVRPRGARGTVGLASAPETENLVPIHRDGRLSLSASRLMTYDDCPLRYFYQYTLGVGDAGGVAASMGTAVHAALAAFLDPRGAQDRSWTALEDTAASLWIDAGWSETIAPYQPLRDQARRDIFTMLEEWWRAESTHAEATGGWPDVVAVEYPFEITVGGHRVRGSIDRVDRVPGGIAIVDYKTGTRVPRPEEVADDLQLATYHLAAVRDPVLAAIGPPVSLALCYLRSGAQPSQPIAAGHADRTELRIIEAANRILSEDFEPSVDADCDYCDFWRLCPLQIEGRQVGGE